MPQFSSWRPRLEWRTLPCHKPSTPKENDIQRFSFYWDDKTSEYECTICNYTTPHRRFLIMHFVSHSESRPFKCKCCTYRAKRISDLRRHKKKMHGKESLTRSDYCRNWSDMPADNSDNEFEHIEQRFELQNVERPVTEVVNPRVEHPEVTATNVQNVPRPLPPVPKTSSKRIIYRPIEVGATDKIPKIQHPNEDEGSRYVPSILRRKSASKPVPSSLAKRKTSEPTGSETGVKRACNPRSRLDRTPSTATAKFLDQSVRPGTSILKSMLVGARPDLGCPPIVKKGLSTLVVITKQTTYNIVPLSVVKSEPATSENKDCATSSSVKEDSNVTPLPPDDVKEELSPQVNKKDSTNCFPDPVSSATVATKITGPDINQWNQEPQIEVKTEPPSLENEWNLEPVVSEKPKAENFDKKKEGEGRQGVVEWFVASAE